MAEPEARLKALMTAALSGDAAAYRALLTESGRLLRAYYARRLGAGAADLEDLVQETLIAMHARRATYDVTQPLTPWLHAIARYKLIDHLRRSGRRRQIPLDDAGDLADAQDQDAAIARRDVEKLIETLPERSRQLVRDVKVEGRSVEEIAARTGMSESAVKVTVHRAIRALQVMLKREPDA